jgi:hypothetical protein
LYDKKHVYFGPDPFIKRTFFHHARSCCIMQFANWEAVPHAIVDDGVRDYK